jgi:hypothetical protein
MAFMISRMTSPDRSTDLAGFGKNAIDRAKNRVINRYLFMASSWDLQKGFLLVVAGTGSGGVIYL